MTQVTNYDPAYPSQLGSTGGAAGGSTTIVVTTNNGGMVPFYIEPGDVFTVPLYKQALFKDTIEVDGMLVVLGRLVGVD